MIRACVIGYPLKHSLSPVIHNEWFRRYRIDGSYDARPVDPDTFAMEMPRLAASYNGFNVTIPYKEKILEYCATMDAAAQAIGAVNTVVAGADGLLHGRNTDAFGFTENLKQHQPGFDWRKGPALVLGAGGAARAILQALREQGVGDIIVTNRSQDRAETLAAHFGARTIPWDQKDRALAQAHLLVNTTSLGMTGQDPLDIDTAGLPPDTVVYDIVYAPLMTPLLVSAQRRGNPIVTGIGMLLHQARPAFQAWTGILPDVDDALVALVLGKTS